MQFLFIYIYQVRNYFVVFFWSNKNNYNAILNSKYIAPDLNFFFRINLSFKCYIGNLEVSAKARMRYKITVMEDLLGRERLTTIFMTQTNCVLWLFCKIQ